MNHYPPILVLAVMVAVCLGVPLGLYALLTQRRRRAMSEIKSAASEHGWNYSVRRWLGDPTAFRIDGWTRSGLKWILKSRGASDANRKWTVQVSLRFPRLAGEVDVAVFPRGSRGHDLGGRDPDVFALHLSPEAQARVAAFSGTASSAVSFFRDAKAAPSGYPEFDNAYHVLALNQGFGQAPIDAALAERFLKWPADSVAPHSVLAWRDPFGVHLQARLPGPANWATITYFVSLAEDFCARLPAPVSVPAPQGFVDRLAARFL